MKKIITVVILTACLTGIASAQFSNWFWSGHTDYPLPEQPCDTRFSVVNAVPFTHDGRLWVLYHCSDNSVWARQFTASGTVQVQTVAVPVQTQPGYTCTTIQPGPDWACVNGNWLPPGS